MRAIAARAAVVALACASSAGCQQEPPVLPSALFVVDTDLPVPRTVTRLRVDVFAEDGTWLHARDYARPRPEDWPVSFAVFSRDEAKETFALVRLRAYVEGATRDYVGERFDPRPAFTPTPYARSLAELCASATELPPFERRTLRRGADPITRDSCGGSGTATGSVAAKITIATKGRYRFQIVDAVPGVLFSGVDVSLSLRRACDTPTPEVACVDNSADLQSLPKLVLDLDPGSYALMTGGLFSGEPADLTLRWAPEAEWGPEDARPAAPIAPTDRPPTTAPRLLAPDGSDLTPSAEPSPPATVDRIVRVRLRSGEQRRVDVTLRGACAGTMAKLALGGDGRVDARASATCTAGPSLEPVAESTDAPHAASLQGTFVSEPCAPEDSDDHVVCVPGGAFVLGGSDLDGATREGSGLPFTLVGLRRFFLDRREVTVGRYRQAIAGGLRGLGLPPLENEGPLGTSGPSAATFSRVPRGRESHPINSISHMRARSVCAFFGGDLPSEAQWEYAALAAGRPRKATYPWGEDPPTCDRVVAQRNVPNTSAAALCPGGPGPSAVDDAANALDVNALGIIGLGGNLTEWTRDAWAPYDSPCWRASGAIDAQCTDLVVLASGRGTSWASLASYARSVGRQPQAPVIGARETGFRCAYLERPTRDWSGP